MSLAPGPLYWPNLHLASPSPPHRSQYSRHRQSPEHSRTGELEHLPDQYCHSIGCPLSCPASICTLDFATWPSSAGQKTVKISAFLLKRKILRNISKQSRPLYQKVESVSENNNFLEGQSHLTVSYIISPFILIHHCYWVCNNLFPADCRQQFKSISN